jgi:hypothetical protein
MWTRCTDINKLLCFLSYGELNILSKSPPPPTKYYEVSQFFLVSKNGVAKPNEKSLPKEIDKKSKLQLMFLFF